jgi:hypothetical protein
MKPNATIPILLAAAALAPPALAGGSALTRHETIVRGSAICKAAERKVDALPQPKSQNPFARNAPEAERARGLAFVAGYANALAGVRSGLAKLDAPPAGRELLESFITQLGPTIEAFRSAHAEALAGRDAQALADVQRGFGLFARASAKTKAYGFPKGVCQSGSS